MNLGEVRGRRLTSPKRGSWVSSGMYEGEEEALDAKDFFFGSPPLFA